MEPFLGGISRNEFWVLEISCVLASSQDVKTRTRSHATKTNKEFSLSGN